MTTHTLKICKKYADAVMSGAKTFEIRKNDRGYKVGDKYDEEFDFLGWHFHFWGNDYGDTPRYGATMSRDGETWECDYDYMFWDDSDDIH